MKAIADLTVVCCGKAITCILKELETNRVPYYQYPNGKIDIEDSPKGRMAIRMTTERFPHLIMKK